MFVFNLVRLFLMVLIDFLGESPHGHVGFSV